jgi:hypothetical protein
MPHWSSHANSGEQLTPGIPLEQKLKVGEMHILWGEIAEEGYCGERCFCWEGFCGGGVLSIAILDFSRFKHDFCSSVQHTASVWPERWQGFRLSFHVGLPKLRQVRLGTIHETHFCSREDSENASMRQSPALERS